MKIIEKIQDIPSELVGIWEAISINLVLSENFIREHNDKVDWIEISEHQVLSEDFIREFEDKVYWSDISQYQVLSEDFIREFEDNVRWSKISRYQVLSEDFIREFEDKVDWENISKHQKLSEDFIREHINDVYWFNIGVYQNLSNEFVNEFSKLLFGKGLKEYLLLKSVHYCGKHNRVIFINKRNPDIIHIGCTPYSKDEAIAAISEKYTEQERDDYINKVLECFEI